LVEVESGGTFESQLHQSASGKNIKKTSSKVLNTLNRNESQSKYIFMCIFFNVHKKCRLNTSKSKGRLSTLKFFYFYLFLIGKINNGKLFCNV
jgi:hypothetical protein